MAEPPRAEGARAALSFLVHQPPSEARAALVFLHGAGEGFLDDAPGVKPEKHAEGLKNLWKLGPPELLSDPRQSLDAAHPLRQSFVTIAPQLPSRQLGWDAPAVESEILRVIAAVAPGKPLFLLGFSKGGKGAFQLASGLSARAIFTIDASHLGEEDFWEVADRCEVPHWCVYTEHAPSDRLYRNVTQLHERMNRRCKPHAPGLLRPPARDGHWKSLVPVSRWTRNPHAEICRVASRHRSPYDWLLSHL